MLSYLRRHHVGLLALLIALGGTSYAATALPKNSVGTKQIKAKAVSEPKLAAKVRAKLNATQPGPAGPAGPQGPKGDQGEQGIQGIQGPQGPTSVGVGGINTTVSPMSSTSLAQPASVSLAEAGKILVVVAGTFTTACTGSGCGRTLSVWVDDANDPSDTPRVVTGAMATVGNATAQPATLMGVLPNVPAGTYSVQLRSQMSGTITTSSNDFRVVAVGLGG